MNFLTMVTNFTEGASEMFKNTSVILNQHNTSTTEDPLNAAETPVSDDNREVARLIQVFMRPILIILGTYGNAMSFYIMRRGSLKKLSTCFYMAMLAIADTRESRSILHYITGKGSLHEVSTCFHVAILTIADTHKYNNKMERDLAKKELG